MNRLFLAILLLASLPSTAQSVAGKPASDVVCYTPAQRQRLADSLATLPVVRQAAQQFRLSADTYREQVGVEQQRKLDAMAQVEDYKYKARKRGVVVVVLTAILTAVTYLAIR